MHCRIWDWRFARRKAHVIYTRRRNRLIFVSQRPDCMSDESRGKNEDGKLLYCSFCGKSQHEVRKLIAGPSVFICDECVELCNDIIREELEDTGETGHDKLPKPQEINESSTSTSSASSARRKSCRSPFTTTTSGSTIARRALQGRHRARQEQYPADRPDGLRQDAAGRDAGASAQRAVHDRRRDDADRSRLRR